VGVTLESRERVYERDLNPIQARAVRHGDGPLLVLAGAGSGKTRVLTYRVAYLVRELGVSPRRIFAVTFTNKAAGEMKRRVADLIGAGAALAWIGTFHSMCARILRTEARWGWWEPGYTIYDEDDQTSLVKASMERVGVAGTVFSPRAILSRISRAKDRLEDPDAFAARGGDYFHEIVSKVYAEYQRGLSRNNALDFDDLIFEVVKLLRRESRVLEAYSRRFEHVLVDEYQDTSHAQYVLVNLLSSHHGNICVVGDDDQSIYGWRGADISNILDFENDHPETKVIRLEQNYRSTSNILDAAHDVIRNNKMRKEKKLWTERDAGCPVRLTRTSNEYQEADAIRNAVLSHVESGQLAYHDFAVLYRTHAQSRVIEDSLRRAGIAYDIIGGVRFYERSEVKDVLAYLRVVANPADDVSLRRIINVPPRKVGKRTMQVLDGFAEREGVALRKTLERLSEIDGLPKAAEGPLASFAGALDAAASRVAGGSPVDEVLASLVDESGYRAWLERRKTEQAQERLANVEELISAAAEFAETGGEAGAAAFLEQVSLVANIDMWNDRANAVSLMTLHNAKGLEFPVVLVPGLEDGLLPHESSFEDDEELDEERRLFYVGMTRAMDELHLFASDTRRRSGVMTVRAASRFLDEIDPARLEIDTTWSDAGRPGRTSGWRRRRGREPRSAFPDYEGESQERHEIRPGSRVTHPTWGEGTVLDVAGYGDDTIVRVRFDDDVEKRIMVRYGGLEVLTD